MSALGALITVGVVGGLVGVPLVTSLIAQDAAKKADEDNQRFLKKGAGAVEGAVGGAQEGLDPYANAGENALQQQQALSGALGPDAQQAAYAQIQNSPAFQAQMQAQERAILGNASATGGLRGGNVQQALAGNASALLGQAIAQQYSQYQGLSQAGQQAASQQGAFGVQGGGLLADIFGQRGASAAGARLGVADAQVQGINTSSGNALGLIKAVAPTGAV